MKEREITLTGIYLATPRGYGFLRPDGGGEDLFVPPRSDGGAWHGDRVSARIVEQETGEGTRRVAAVEEVLERVNHTVTGTLLRRERRLWLAPDNDRIPGPILIPGRGKEGRAGDRAAVRISSYGAGHTGPIGMVEEVFGRSGDREAGVAAVLYENGISPDWPAPVLAEAERAPDTVPGADIGGRLDLRGTFIITIDGASAKDLDDAVSLRRDGAGRWHLGVHIADVGHYVTPGSALDKEAFARGASLYYADRVVPMLPPALSNGICSLHPDVDRLTLSCFLTLTPDGEVAERSFARTVIRSARRMTYETCNDLLAGTHPDPEAEGAVLPLLREMEALSRTLKRLRRLRGSLELGSNEVAVLCDMDGAPVGTELRRGGPSEEIIESFMLAANEAVAEHLNRLEKPMVYRVHERPPEEKSETLRALLATLGYDMKGSDNHALQKILKQAEGRPEQPVVSMLVLRSLTKARYDIQNLGHNGLAAPYYCHFTSPIRRYPDLMVHRVLAALLDGTLKGRAEKRLAAACAAAATQSSQRELAIQNAERTIEKMYLAEYMSGQVGAVFEGLITGVARFGLFLTLPSGVEGMIPAEALPGGHYRYDEGRMTLFDGQTGARFSPGMVLTVVCLSTDPAAGQIVLGIEGQSAPQMARPAAKVRVVKPPAQKKKGAPAPRHKRRGRR